MLIAAGTPLREHWDVVAAEVVVEVLAEVVTTVTAVVARVLFFCFGVHAAVTVMVVPNPVAVAVEVTSAMGTNEEQKAEAFRATRAALQAPTPSRGSKSARGICKAEANERMAAPLTKTWGRYMTTDR